MPYNPIADPITHKLLLGEDAEATSRQTLPLVPEKQIHSNFINTLVNYNKEQSEAKSKFSSIQDLPRIFKTSKFHKALLESQEKYQKLLKKPFSSQGVDNSLEIDEDYYLKALFNSKQEKVTYFSPLV